MSRTCPHPKCHRPVHDSCFACREHWFALPLPLRFKIKDAFTNWSAKRITLDALRAIQDEGETWFRQFPDARAEKPKAIVKRGSDGAWSCSCPDHLHRRRECKHIKAVQHARPRNG